jgi:hypothetical protein
VENCVYLAIAVMIGIFGIPVGAMLLCVALCFWN